MVTLDFSKCKSKEDVDKVFGMNSSEIENAKENKRQIWK